MDGQKPADRRRGPLAELRRRHQIPEQGAPLGLLPVQQQERAGQRRNLRPQRAAGRLLAGFLRGFDGVLPQPPFGFSGALQIHGTQEHLCGNGHRLGGHVLRGVARNVPHHLGRPLHARQRVLLRLRLLDVPFRREDRQRERDGQPAGQSLCGLGVQRLLRLRHQGGLSVRPPAGAQHRVGMEKTEGRPDRLRHDQMGRETRKQPLSG